MSNRIANKIRSNQSILSIFIYKAVSTGAYTGFASMSASYVEPWEREICGNLYKYGPGGPNAAFISGPIPSRKFLCHM